MNGSLSTRPIILTFARHYLPGYKAGGPIRSIANTVEWLGEKYDFRIVTSDRDYTDSTPYTGILVDAWNSVGKAKVLYLPPNGRGWGRMRQILSEDQYDLLYLNSFFDPEFTLKPLLIRRWFSALKKPAILAPRGELSDGSRRLKAWKKAPFLALAKQIGLYGGLTWHASTIHDKVDISRTMGVSPQDIHVAANLPSPASTRSRAPEERAADKGGPLRICFLSRISPEKNLDYALDVLRRVRVPLHFDIYGPIRDNKAYWGKCRKQMSDLPGTVSATYHGSIAPQAVVPLLASYDLFFLPTRGENFGHVILESICAGTPVLIADTTPWRELAAKGIGWEFPLATPEAFVQKIEDIAAMPHQERTQVRNHVLAFADGYRNDTHALEATNELFLRALRNDLFPMR